MPFPTIGSLAPDVTLATTAGKMVTLSSFRGQKNVLLAFFPLAFTGTCTKELCAFSDDYTEFAGHEVEVIPVSVDAVPSLKAFKEKTNSQIEFASDFKRDATRTFGVLNDEKFYSNRAYFLIDKAGTLRWSHVESNNSERRENSEILAEIAKLPS